MAEICPFRGVRYNQQKIHNLASVICPPYDIISLEMQHKLYQTSQYNFVRIEYNQEYPQDNDQNNRYTRASANINQWIKENILIKDLQPAFYIHEHHFFCQGKSYNRKSIIAGVKLEDWTRKIIRPHENIIPRAKSDRLSMLRYCQANTSQVLAMYEDPRKIIIDCLEKQKQQNPIIDFTDAWNERHKVWTMDQPEMIKTIQKELAQRPLYIADGHHRYDSALTYQQEIASQHALITGKEGFNYVMTSLIDFVDPGLVILPTHRLVKGLSKAVLDEFKSRLGDYFDIQGISLVTSGVWEKVDMLLTGMGPEMQTVRLAILGLEPEYVTILTLRNFQATSEMIPGYSDLYSRLDVSLVDHILLDKLLAFDKDKSEGNLEYTHDRSEAINKVKNGQFQLAFIMNPIKPELIKAIADAGARMPRKSTYFYPKSPAGLVFYKW